jgi:hypothetical protein
LSVAAIVVIATIVIISIEHEAGSHCATGVCDGVQTAFDSC